MDSKSSPLPQPIYRSHYDPDWKELLRGRPDAAVLAASDPKAVNVLRAVPKGASLVKVGSAVLGYRATPARIRRQIGLLDLRIIEIERIIVSRFGVLRIDTDDAGLIAEIVAAHAEPNRASIWIAKVCPAIDPDEAIAAASSRRWTAARLGKALNLTLAERTSLGIKTIRAADVTPRDAAAFAAARKREMERARIDQKRRDAGIQKRRDGDAAAEAAAALGISRRTLFNRRKRGLHPNVGNKLNNTSNAEVHIGAASAAPMPFVPAWMWAAFAGPAISITDPECPPEAQRLGILVAAAAQAARALPRHAYH